jgi:ketosteroid isomerase-like protein
MCVDQPSIVRRFWDSAARRDFDAVAECFTEDAEVTDENEVRRGRAAIAAWQAAARAKWDYTVTATGGERTVDGGFKVMARLDGNFPGGVADVAYTFSLKDGLIHRLTIE